MTRLYYSSTGNGEKLALMGGYAEHVESGNDFSGIETNFISVSDGSTAITYSDIPPGAYTVTIELLDSVIDLSNFVIKWAGGTAPTYTADTDLIFLTTTDKGANWLGCAVTGYA